MWFSLLPEQGLAHRLLDLDSVLNGIRPAFMTADRVQSSCRHVPARRTCCSRPAVLAVDCCGCYLMPVCSSLFISEQRIAHRHLATSASVMRSQPVLVCLICLLQGLGWIHLYPATRLQMCPQSPSSITFNKLYKLYLCTSTLLPLQLVAGQWGCNIRKSSTACDCSYWHYSSDENIYDISFTYLLHLSADCSMSKKRTLT